MIREERSYLAEIVGGCDTSMEERILERGGENLGRENYERVGGRTCE